MSRGNFKSRIMVKLKIDTFEKSVNCPSSEKLLAYQNKESPARERDKIMVHLRFCEFCAAETELYAHFPPAEGPVENSEIPAPLYELAKALLNRKTRPDSFDKWFEDIEFVY